MKQVQERNCKGIGWGDNVSGHEWKWDRPYQIPVIPEGY